MNKPRIWWNGKEWLIDTEVALTSGEMLRCIEYTKKVQEDRYKTLRPGPMKDECLVTIQALETYQVMQNIIGSGDKVLFDAYKSEGKKVFA